MHGRNNDKKLVVVRIFKHAMEIIHLLTDANPIQIIVDAVINSNYGFGVVNSKVKIIHVTGVRWDEDVGNNNHE
ncbi:hypothetical protein Lser_V15G20847 [Lactuca serriola]